MALSDVQALIDGMVRDGSGKIAEADRDQAIGLAVARFSQDRPRSGVEDVVAAAGRFQDLPAGWVPGFSEVREIETPPEADPPSFLAAGDWAIEETASGPRLRLAEGLVAGTVLRIRYTLPHTLDADTDTLPTMAREAVAVLAAAHLLDSLAAATAGDGESTIASDSVDHGSRSDQYAARARELRRRYFALTGVSDQRSPAASAVVNLDLTDSRGLDRLTHPRRFR
jgi:hypothetical protein